MDQSILRSSQNNMEKSRQFLIENHEFYAHLMYQTDLTWTDDDKQCPTAGVRVANNRIQMYVNINFWNDKPLKQQVGILMHELDHIIGAHMIRGDVMGINHQHMNIAADLAINEHNPYIKDIDCLLVDKINKEKNLNLEHNRETEYYARKLLDEDVIKYVDMQELLDKILDDHSQWNNEDVDGATAQEVILSALDEAAKKTSESGKIPGEALDTINKYRTPQYNWKRLLRNFVARAQNTVVKATRSKRNRRFGVSQPGRRTDIKLKLACCVDTSGSVSSEELEKFSAELSSMAKGKGFIIDVIEADYDVQRVYRMDRDGLKDVKGRGGTSY
jgi:predicted metal-dependent peptidase